MEPFQTSFSEEIKDLVLDCFSVTVEKPKGIAQPKHRPHVTGRILPWGGP